MTLTVTIGGTDVTTRVRMEDGLQSVTANADGTYASSGLKVDDEDGSLTISRFQEVIINESNCSRPRMFTGNVIEARPTRGPYATGTGRVWVLDIGDLNLRSHLEAFHLANAKRPEETLSARRDWLLGTVPGSHFVNNGFFPDFSGTFDEADYRGEYADSVMGTFGDIGRIFFLYWDDPDVAVYCAGKDDGFATSTLSISNVLADVNYTSVFPPDPAAELELDMSECYDEVYLRGPFGTYFLSDHDGRLPTGIHRTLVVDTPRVGRLATAQAEAVILLARYAGDVETITCTLILPRDKVNLIDAGMLVPVKFAHLPGYTTYTNLRVAQRTVNLAFSGTDDYYEVTLKLSNRAAPALGGGGGTDGFPHQPSVTPTLVQEKYLGTGTAQTLDNPPTPGNLWILAGVDRVGDGSAGTPAGFTRITGADMFAGITPSHGAEMFYKVIDGADTTAVSSWSGMLVHVSEWTPCTVDSSATAGDIDSASFSYGGAVTAPASSVVLGVAALGNFDALTYDSSAVAGTTQLTHGNGFPGGNTPYMAVGYKTVTTAGSTSVAGTMTPVSATHNYQAGVTIVLVGDATDNPPPPTQWVYGETPTPAPGSGVTTFTTAFAFADGSLKVYVDHVDQTAAVTTYDGAAGTFTLGFDPRSWETILVDYQGR